MNGGRVGRGTGGLGEDAAASCLLQKGFCILQRNYRQKCGEIDIIAADATYIVFVEVKTRGERRLAEPLEAITWSKRRKIIRTALCYLQEFPTALQPRFDAAAVLTQGGKVVSVEYYENIFDGGMYG